MKKKTTSLLESCLFVRTYIGMLPVELSGNVLRHNFVTPGVYVFTLFTRYIKY